MLGLIFRDNRGRSEQIEFVIEANLDLVLLDTAVSNESNAGKATANASPLKRVLLTRPQSVKRYSARTDQLLVMAYWMPPPTVQPTRVVEKLLVPPKAPKGTPAGDTKAGPKMEKSVLNPPKATPPVP